MDVQLPTSGAARVVAGFDWDRGNRDKCQTHGVSLAAIESAFRGPLAVFPDPKHSAAEERFHAIGRTAQGGAQGRWVFIVFTLRALGGETFIRPISGQYMHRREVESYESQAAEAADRSGG